MPDTLTGLLREAACNHRCLTHGFGCGVAEATCKPDLTYKCPKCQTLALAEELERQLAAAQAQMEAIRSRVPSETECPCETCNDLREILAATPAAALAAHDERVRREALEDVLTWLLTDESLGNRQHIASRLRERLGGGNG